MVTSIPMACWEIYVVYGYCWHPFLMSHHHNLFSRNNFCGFAVGWIRQLQKSKCNMMLHLRCCCSGKIHSSNVSIRGSSCSINTNRFKCGLIWGRSSRSWRSSSSSSRSVEIHPEPQKQLQSWLLNLTPTPLLLMPVSYHK